MTPMQKRRIDQLIDERQYDKARQLLRKLPEDKEAKAMLEDMAITYPETTATKFAKGANKAIFYVVLAIALFLAASVIFAVIWTALKR